MKPVNDPKALTGAEASSTLAPMRQARLVWAVCTAAGLACFAGPAGSAVAQRGEVFVDPDSPAGKEYALPLESARRDAAGGSAGSTGSAEPPLFGAGISRRAPATSGGTDAKTGDRAGDVRAGRSSSEEGERGGDAEVRPPSRPAAAVGEDGAGLPAGLLSALIALGVLTVGGAIGLSFRALGPADGRR